MYNGNSSVIIFFFHPGIVVLWRHLRRLANVAHVFCNRCKFHAVSQCKCSLLLQCEVLNSTLSCSPAHPLPVHVPFDESSTMGKPFVVRMLGKHHGRWWHASRMHLASASASTRPGGTWPGCPTLALFVVLRFFCASWTNAALPRLAPHQNRLLLSLIQLSISDSLDRSSLCLAPSFWWGLPSLGCPGRPQAPCSIPLCNIGSCA
mmetsp:Transcript_13507/g.31066  ORF Transcript_13507/g.31066 Transcript_13507/m.31066 type:complete len:205 (-) Transcript_13507:269-883(-)